jgi:hypothetical protein
MMPSSLKLPRAMSPRPASARGLGSEIGAGLVKLPWRRAAMLGSTCALLGAVLWWVWW